MIENEFILIDGRNYLLIYEENVLVRYNVFGVRLLVNHAEKVKRKIDFRR